MKKKALALLAILLTSFALSEAKAVSRAEYCATLLMIYSEWDDEKIEEDMNSSYGWTDAMKDHCL